MRRDLLVILGALLLVGAVALWRYVRHLDAERRLLRQQVTALEDSLREVPVYRDSLRRVLVRAAYARGRELELERALADALRRLKARPERVVAFDYAHRVDSLRGVAERLQEALSRERYYVIRDTAGAYALDVTLSLRGDTLRYVARVGLLPQRLRVYFTRRDDLVEAWLDVPGGGRPTRISVWTDTRPVPPPPRVPPRLRWEVGVGALLLRQGRSLAVYGGPRFRLGPFEVGATGLCAAPGCGLGLTLSARW